MWIMPVDYFTLLTLCVLVAFAASFEDIIPRISFSHEAEDRPVKLFSAEGVFNYSTLLLNEDKSVLYVGAREALFALNVSNFGKSKLNRNLTWSAPDNKRKQCSFKGRSLQTDCFNYVKVFLQLNSTHLFACGTYAFSPICTYIKISDFSLVKNAEGIVTEEGRSRCPFDPEYKSSAIIVDGELYAGTVSNFQGNEPTIYKSLGSGTPLKTENSLNWLQDPSFVGAAYIQESLPLGNPVGDDDKIYFFFSETGKEFDFFDNTIVSRIARVCKGDKGGERVLQKKWTTFLKAHLLCSLSNDGFPFNIIQDMFVLTPGEENWKQTIFYGVFTSQWYTGAASSSAVCSFSMDQVENAFNGRYREVNRETQQWYTYNHPVPEPRPGACINNDAREKNIASSLQMPDKVLNFMKDHFLMDTVIKSLPLLVKRNTRYTQIVVDRVKGPHKHYDVLFIGTDDGKIHKSINVDSEMYIIEEIQLFNESVQTIELDSQKGMLYVSSYTGVAQVPVANCSNYQNCGECILARDPYCAWTGKRCKDIRHASPESHWQQDIVNADTNMICDVQHGRSKGGFECLRFILPPNTFKVLPCYLRSNLARRLWVYNASANNSTYSSPDGGLVVVASVNGQETYECWSIENNFQQLLANYCVEAEKSLEVLTTDRPKTPATLEKTYILPSNEHSAQTEVRTYWNELLIVCILLGATIICFSLFFIYRHRSSMKTFLKEGECSNMQQKKQRIVIPGESLPLNGSVVPASSSDHKGYQALNNYICSTPTHENPDNGKSFSEKRPLNLKESHVEISPSCPRPRVRLGSEIKDSIV
ncbi:sema domain, immunoglobulin domain (Ig), transmembrane domain (TM) and short cytoplasmic domain, (semaphorin) 4Ba [Polypterus senegalus]|uniref:sema domain, immunoglobulin domain (Ig), transmembrane domain (TM) and short cytoplasmic domain, (semaphorin) 4Ba n=1 Tax=Polypterus senegalus TaxID=55291 RepID=UPI00196480C0|nr:sema domain, immunoglobulin domain (Ig), transmembrane domain (TM) and short cytoplasmic domain, (semaphorin) 4Ba [Polypterus senegalus]XP_039629263.1 sema domain, immunoglobulin domain (Ig), transmembrane domain (TM) and short cytoplasmic domain, (semaphorin) 4Ba [Polypterus senegalus]XP_039629264.1 sema domain, immunoglobulin domain (Ig), transmembrane domain (TM) and short cytoplasmic domain, (semaphorin) 4Ba [Polypterus senegalus]XP_039629265.1 sema domain, immunoglobulin domain (Ig), tra